MIRVTQRTALTGAGLALVLIVALAARLNNLAFGLPSMWDPDEPIFMIKAVELLSDGTLNPKWFGHPGTTTIYLIALTDALVVGWARLTGAAPDTQHFIRAAFADPSLLFIPARAIMALVGVSVVALTFAVACRLHGRAAGLIAAAFLAVNALHIAWSQVVRTDIHASLFMLLSLWFAIGAAKHGRLRDFAVASLFVGFAMATKWPAAVGFAAVCGALALRVRTAPSERPQFARTLALALGALLAGLFIGSPYIFIDWQTVLANVGGEVKSGHLAQNGGGLLHNLDWYVGGPLVQSMGWLGVGLAAIGAGIAGARDPVARATIVPVALLFLILISSQSIIYARWLLPVLPLLCIFAAYPVTTIAEMLTRRHRPVLVAAIAALALTPAVAGAVAQGRERANDTRGQAARWAAAHIPAGSTVLIEHLEFALRGEPWTILFPLGEAGCIDGKAALEGEIRYSDIQAKRKGSPIVDLGNIPPDRRATCRADYAILTYYDLYVAEAARYPAELQSYRTILGGGRTVALFDPRPGVAGGPRVRIVALPNSPPEKR